jgi:hypothetical protein
MFWAMADDVGTRIQRFVNAPLFPLTSSMELKQLGPLMDAEIVREGEGDRQCHACGKPERVLWTNGRWQIASFQATANPVLLFLETVEHLDFATLDEAMAAEFGVLTWRLEAAISELDAVGRVHVHRWADGSSHFHVWFQGRPARQLEFYGWGNVLWSQLADPLGADMVNANHALVIEHFIARLK